MSTFEVIGANIWLIKISQERKILKEKKIGAYDRERVCVCISMFSSFIIKVNMCE